MPMGAAPARRIGGAETQHSAQAGVSGPPPLPISSCCCPWEGGNAEQKAHDEPSKHKSISSLVTQVTRVGHHQPLMLGASTRHGVGAQWAPRGPGERHNVAKRLAGAPRLCRSSWGGWQRPPLRDGDRQPCPCSRGWGDAAQVSSTGPACRCWCVAGCGRPPLPLQHPAATQLPAQPGKLWAPLGAKFAPVLWPLLAEKGDVPRGKGLPLVTLHAHRTAPPPRGPAGPLPFLPLIFQPALLLGA